MGCISSKHATKTASPAPTLGAVVDVVPSSKSHSGVSVLEAKSSLEENKNRKFKKNSSKKSGAGSAFSFKIGFSGRYVEAEQNAAGWPPWLTASAAEAVQGWIPLKADAFQKLDKIGQGTYSSVFRAREVETGRMFALKKVRFDTFQAESIRFMAREITILRRLDHPNIMKLEGIITSKMSNSLYLVFEYMEHDLAGLVSRPDIVFTDAQIKCYMRQLLSGIEHCHVRGIMHRDIKVSNILLNNEGVLKIGDFGLANTISPNNKHPLTSRVVTLWYRPPELLMGATNYGVSVDLWSVGCVFAELFLGKPILKGRTEVEQLHKIFKLCGSPPDEFWKKNKLPHSTMFKPQANYESSLKERCADFPESAVSLLETLLSIDHTKRGTASSALISEYFNTKPYACNPSSLPKYPPSKEMDAKSLDETTTTSRKKTDKSREAATSRRQQRRGPKGYQDQNHYGQSTSKETFSHTRKDDGRANIPKGKGGSTISKDHTKTTMDAMLETSQRLNVADGNGYSVPVQVNGGSHELASWTKRRKQDASSTLSDGSRSKISALDPNFAKGTYDLTNQRVSMDFDPKELRNAQGQRDEQGTYWNDGVRRAARKSRFGRDV
ncbi:protein IMPAIRED IN BABA-INDUCED STERILITY 1-like [Trifolium pratense]|uniref:protein IMPAIRED IN BABA-INDUCED STERILITY 1-like n=1 Tax=Trifolium pratense TaxID=57577 RepID=UPI001E6915EA|nr:protein IMPAIRED IN BABA-INDUCED STERILITY 1-like [Trifolium pratense]